MRPALAVGRKGAGSRFVHKSNKDLSVDATRFAGGPGYEFALAVQQGV